MSERVILNFACETNECRDTVLQVKTVDRAGNLQNTRRKLVYAPVYRKEWLNTLTVREQPEIITIRQPLLIKETEDSEFVIDQKEK